MYICWCGISSCFQLNAELCCYLYEIVVYLCLFSIQFKPIVVVHLILELNFTIAIMDKFFQVPMIFLGVATSLFL